MGFVTLDLPWDAGQLGLECGHVIGLRSSWTGWEVGELNSEASQLGL